MTVEIVCQRQPFLVANEIAGQQRDAPCPAFARRLHDGDGRVERSGENALPHTLGLEQSAMSGDTVNADALLVEQDIVAYLQYSHGREELGTHEVGQVERVLGRANKQRPTFGQSRHGFARNVIVGNEPTAVLVAPERMVVELAEHFVHVYFNAEQLLILFEEAYPSIEVRRAVVAMHHSHGTSVGRCYHVDHLVGLGEALLQHNHGERRCSGRHVAGALPDGIGCHHARAGVSFGRTEGTARFQVSRRVEQGRTLLGQLPGSFTGELYLRQNVAKSPTEVERLGKLFELLNHRCVVVLGLRMNRQHARSVAYAEHLLAR